MTYARALTIAALLAAAGSAQASDPIKDNLERLGKSLPQTQPVGAGLIATDATGPDVIVGSLYHSFSSDSNETMPPRATLNGQFSYGVGTVSCNIGNVNLLWDDASARKPVIAQNMYRIANGRITQIGGSWLKHGFTALSGSLCTSCSGSGGGWTLGIGCSDPYSSGLNASTSTSGSGGLGPRYEVNPFTGVYAWPIQTTTTVAPVAATGMPRRMIVNASDYAGGINEGVRYVVEGIYITPDDHAFGNSGNNASYRQVTTQQSTGNINFSSAAGFRTERTKPAIYAWQDLGGPNGTPDSSVLITRITQGATYAPGAWQVINNVAPGGQFYLPNPPTGDGELIVGSKAIDLGNGRWRYEYAVYNLTSERMAGSFTVPFPAGATITNVTHTIPLQHSGVPADDATRNAPWTQTVGSSSVTWASANPFDPARPRVFNAVTWGYLWNFSFEANVAPVNTGQARVGFYRPGTPADLGASAWVPNPGTTFGCYANCDGSTEIPVLNALDFACFLDRFTQGRTYANCDGSTTIPILNALDFACFLDRYQTGCAN